MGWRTYAMRVLVTALAAVVGCSRGPVPIPYGTQSCDFCGMTISDPRFGAELVTARGKVYTFDSAECLASYYLTQDSTARAGASVWVTDFQHPNTFIPATTARYVFGAKRIHSPMGRGLLALGPHANVTDVAREFQGEPMSWTQLLGAVQQEATHDEAVAHEGQVRTIVVGGPTGIPTIAAAIAKAQSGDRIIITPGVYREPTIVVNKPVTLEGQGRAILDGESKRQIVTVVADDVTIRRLELRNVGVNDVDDWAAIKVLGVRRCTIEDNRIDNAFFGIYLAGSVDCRVLRNTIRGQAQSEVTSGNGIHLWSARNALIAGNHIRGHRDGVYFEFVKNTQVRDNVSEHNVRYGLHFMYSDDCYYEQNVFRDNIAGVAVMYTHRVAMIGNRFEHNWGSASYGLLFKEIFDSRVERNVFVGNTVGLMADGANRIVATGNDFRSNGWAIKLLSNTEDGRFERNNFMGNTFDVAMGGSSTTTRFSGNYWDDYRGYDLNRDGTGDVPFRPVRLFSMIVSQNPPALILLRSVFVRALDVAERVLPILTPAAVADDHPAMRPLV
jgi:nitrous oxidase accessory protein